MNPPANDGADRDLALDAYRITGRRFAMSAEERELFARTSASLLTIPYCPWEPNWICQTCKHSAHSGECQQTIGESRRACRCCTNDPIPSPQVHFLLDFGREALYGGAAGGGKAQRLTELIPTPNGFKKLEELHPGDSVLGRDGRPCTILAESAVNDLAGWRFLFDDGSSVVSNDEHLWLTFDAAEMASLTRHNPEWRKKRRDERPKRGTGVRPDLAIRNSAHPTASKAQPEGTVRRTVNIAATLKTSSGRANHAVPVCEPLELPEVDLPLDPYIFGMWLGDGTSVSGQFTSADDELVEAYSVAGFGAHKVGASPYLYGTYGLQAVLRQMGVLGNKHVPEVYLWASIPQRLALLQGLMDTDGTVTKSGLAEFCNTNLRIVEAVAHLLRSLGHKVRVSEGRAKFQGRDCGPKWTLKFAAHMPVFRLQRKAMRLRLSSRRTTKFRYIVGAERTDPEPMKCLTVSADDSLFLTTDHFIPTHNSVALLMAASQFLHIPGYAALLLRKSYRDLERPGALMDLAAQWWREQPGVKFNSQAHAYQFVCPGGGYSTVTFGSMDEENDRYKYQGGGWSYVGWDELTQFKERDYTYLFSRVRRVRDPDNPLSRVPIRVRAATNPGGTSHEWVMRRFVTPWIAWKKGEGVRPSSVTGQPRNFYPALISDNPKLDEEDYIASLMELPPVERAQLMKGDWNIRPDGRMFARQWFRPIDYDDVPGNLVWVRFWDMASTDEKVDNEPDYTAGGLVGRAANGKHYIMNVSRWRKDAADNDVLVRWVGEQDSKRVPVGMEQEPGGQAKIALHHYRTYVLPGFNFRGFPTGGKRKIIRAGPVASLASAGQVYMVKGVWNDEFLDEIELFPDGSHDDQVDAVSGAFAMLAKSARGVIRLGAPNEALQQEAIWRPEKTIEVASVLNRFRGVSLAGMEGVDAGVDYDKEGVSDRVSAAWSM